MSSDAIESAAIEFIEQIVWSYDRHGPYVGQSPRNDIDVWIRMNHPELAPSKYEMMKAIRKHWDAHKRMGPREPVFHTHGFGVW